MYLFLYTMLLAGGGALANFRGYNTRNLFVSDEPNLFEEFLFVDCPVCNNTWPPIEKCDLNLNGKRYKRCQFGTYVNTACNDRIDCRRGPGDKCSTYENEDKFDVRCLPGYHCDRVEHVCTGGDYIPIVVDHYNRSPSSFSGTDNKRSIDFYNSRDRRTALYPFFAPH